MNEHSDLASPVSRPVRRRRWLTLLVLGGVAVAAALFVREYYFSHPVGSGPAGPAVDPSGFAQPWTNRPVLVLGLGDSITAGLGAKTQAHAFFSRLVTAPPDEFPDLQRVNLSAVLPRLTAQNLAVSGTNSLQHRDVIETDLPVQEAQVLGLVVMTTGGNDLIHWYGQKPPKEGAMYGATLEQAEPWIAAFEQRLGVMLDLIAERFPGGCHIFLGDIYDPTDGVGDAPVAGLPAWPDGLAIHARYNDILRRAAASRPFVHLVPLHATFLGHGIHCRQFWREHYRADDPTYWYYGNIEDPNDRGHDAARRAFLIEIQRVSGQFDVVEQAGPPPQ